MHTKEHVGTHTKVAHTQPTGNPTFDKNRFSIKPILKHWLSLSRVPWLPLCFSCSPVFFCNCPQPLLAEHHHLGSSRVYGLETTATLWTAHCCPSRNLRGPWCCGSECRRPQHAESFTVCNIKADSEASSQTSHHHPFRSRLKEGGLVCDVIDPVRCTWITPSPAGSATSPNLLVNGFTKARKKVEINFLRQLVYV